jgi:UDP-glucose 4-epimerase
MRILFTGASSFTGYHFVQALVRDGHELVCTLTKDPNGYSGQHRARVQKLMNDPRIQWQYSVEFGDDRFLKTLERLEPEIVCHHGAMVGNFRSESFDLFGAIENNARGAKEVMQRMAWHHARKLIVTGTVFEQGEGFGAEKRAFNEYGLSKGLAYQVFKHYGERSGVPVRKFVIPNPIGPMDQPRFTAHLMETWRVGQVAQIKTPHYVRDNIHVDLLAMCYSGFVLSDDNGMDTLGPSGYVSTVGEFVAMMAKEVRDRTGWACAYEALPQSDWSEPRMRFNQQDAVRYSERYAYRWDEKAAWDALVGEFQP